MADLSTPKFNVGRCSISCEAHAYLESCEVKPEFLVRRHACGDWGDINDWDKAANDAAIVTGSHIMSSYNVNGTPVWVRTDQETKRTVVFMSVEGL